MVDWHLAHCGSDNNIDVDTDLRQTCLFTTSYLPVFKQLMKNRRQAIPTSEQNL